MDYLTYDFTRSEDINKEFADKEMGCTNHINYFSLCLMEDDRIIRKSLKTYLDCVISSELSEGFRVILPSRLSVSTYLSVLHYPSFLGTCHFSLSAIFTLSHFHPQSFYTLNHFTLLAILHHQ
jgi:hypothetical protein